MADTGLDWYHRKTGETMNRLSAKAVIVGGLVGVLCSGFFDVVLVSLFMARHGVLHSVDRHAHAAAASAMQASTPTQAASLLIGFGTSAVGGFVAARLAGHDELLNGACSSFLGLLIGVLTIASGRESRSWTVQAIILLLSPILGLLGGYLEIARSRRSLPPKLA
jgi:hypothetical protein